jgi:hypothetical protein
MHTLVQVTVLLNHYVVDRLMIVIWPCFPINCCSQCVNFVELLMIKCGTAPDNYRMNDDITSSSTRNKKESLIKLSKSKNIYIYNLYTLLKNYSKNLFSSWFFENVFVYIYKQVYRVVVGKQMFWYEFISG